MAVAVCRRACAQNGGSTPGASDSRSALRGQRLVVLALYLVAVAPAAEFPLAQIAPWPAGNVQLPPGRVLSLDGVWRFAVDPDGALGPEDALHEATRRILVPACWEAACPDLVDYDGAAWYVREFDVPPEMLRARRLILRFDAADYAAEVWLNGRRLGGHEGGYTPFEFDVTGLCKRTGNVLVVRVIDVGTDRRRSGGVTIREVPNGKQSHYCNIGGLWQSVKLLARGRCYVHSVFVQPLPGKRVRVFVLMDGALAGRTVRASVAAVGKPPVAWRSAPAARVLTFNLHVPQLPLWSPEKPELCVVRLAVRGPEGVEDECFATFGLRTISVHNRQVCINGRPVFLAGALDQAFYPYGIYRPASPALLERQFRAAKRAGLTMLRTHIKIPVLEYLQAADKLGLLLWVDFPSWYAWNEPVRRRVERQMAEWVWRDYNHPALIVWCLINEEWGMNFRAPEVRAWIARMWRTFKSWDPTRLAVDNSPAGGGHIISDIADQHSYVRAPERADDWAAWVARYTAHPERNFKWPESRYRGTEPVVVSEFGTWGLPDTDALLCCYGGQRPYWFFQRSYGGPVANLLDNFQKWALGCIYGPPVALATATQRHQADALKYEIEVMRRHGVAGYVITQFTDLNAESNGLFDMCRRPKLAAREIAPVHAQRALIAIVRQRAWLAGSALWVPIELSNFSDGDVPPGVLRWRLDGTARSGAVQAASVPAGRCGKLCTVKLRLPDVHRPTAARLRFRLIAGGREVARNFLDLSILPRAAVELPASVRVAWPDRPVEGADVAVVRRINPQVARFIRSGGRAVLLAESTDAFGALLFDGLHIADRNRKSRMGNWLGAFCWMREGGGFRMRWPWRGHLGMEFIDIAPKLCIDGVRPQLYAAAWSGLFVAWLHNPATLIQPLRVGDGALVICTYRLWDGSQRGDPLARAMMASLIEAAAKLDPQTLPAAGRVAILDQVVVPTAEAGGHTWRYTTAKPPEGWQAPEFDDSGWAEGLSGFGKPGTPGAIVRTRWTTSDIWLRTEFRLEAPPTAGCLRIHHDEDAEVYLNGRLIARFHGYLVGYTTVPLALQALGAFRSGRNVLAIHCRQTVGGQYIDAGLFVGRQVE